MGDDMGDDMACGIFCGGGVMVEGVMAEGCAAEGAMDGGRGAGVICAGGSHENPACAAGTKAVVKLAKPQNVARTPAASLILVFMTKTILILL